MLESFTTRGRCNSRYWRCGVPPEKLTKTIDFYANSCESPQGCVSEKKEMKLENASVSPTRVPSSPHMAAAGIGLGG